VDESGRLTVVVPSAPFGYRAIVAAFNSDGQSSLFLQGDNPPVYTYDDPAVGGASASLSPSSLAAGTETLIDVVGTNTNFVDGQTSLGFGSSDIVVRRYGC
jgi:hypothetical protein